MGIIIMWTHDLELVWMFFIYKKNRMGAVDTPIGTLLARLIVLNSDSVISVAHVAQLEFINSDLWL